MHTVKHFLSLAVTFGLMSFLFKQGRAGTLGATAQSIFNTVS